jgi:hypothetical protein
VTKSKSGTTSCERMKPKTDKPRSDVSVQDHLFAVAISARLDSGATCHVSEYTATKFESVNISCLQSNRRLRCDAVPTISLISDVHQCAMGLCPQRQAARIKSQWKSYVSKLYGNHALLSSPIKTMFSPLAAPACATTDSGDSSHLEGRLHLHARTHRSQHHF